ncbi:MAG: exodeoxyribonuclease I [Candidatus Saccharimonadales bacterium]
MANISARQTFFFYDLETSGFSARDDRVMQFAGQRTDMKLKKIGEPVNLLVKLTDDILPSPDAIMVTGITPQATLNDGYSEKEFCDILMSDVFTEDTIAVGFNNVRFDDEFIRHTLWRNFYDPYEWSWADGRGRWDMLDVVRMTRALRPKGIEWPTDETGKAVNKLELLGKANNLTHTHAHDALSDVEVLIDLARLLRDKQPKLYDYLFSLRDKKAVANLVNLDDPKPFVYTSGRYDPAHEKTTIAFPIAPGTKPGSVLVYDLRHDPSPFLNASPRQLASIIFADRDTRAAEGFVALPVKELAYNRCPAVAPVGVVDDAARERLAIDMSAVQRHMSILAGNSTFGAAVQEAFEMREPYTPSADVEHQLYDGFMSDKDKGRCAVVRGAGTTELADFHPQFVDERLPELLFRYKARQFPESLSEDEHTRWEQYRATKLQQLLPSYFDTLERLQRSRADQYLLEELHLWAESIAP